MSVQTMTMSKTICRGGQGFPKSPNSLCARLASTVDRDPQIPPKPTKMPKQVIVYDLELDFGRDPSSLGNASRNQVVARASSGEGPPTRRLCSAGGESVSSRPSPPCTDRCRPVPGHAKLDFTTSPRHTLRRHPLRKVHIAAQP